jgi:hypothetical protein
MTTYQADSSFPSLGEAYHDVRRRISGVVETAGPALDLRGLRAAQFEDVAPLVPDLAQTELKLIGGASTSTQDFAARVDELHPIDRWDRLMAFFSHYGCLEMKFDQPAAASVVFNFSQPLEPKDESKAIPFDQLIPAFGRVALVREALLQLGMSEPGADRWGQTLVHTSSSKFGHRPFRDEEGAIEFRIQVGDDRLNLNHVFSISTPVDSDSRKLSLFAGLVHSLNIQRGWRATLYGGMDRIGRMIRAFSEDSASVSYGNTTPRMTELARLEASAGSDAWRAEALRAVAAPECVERLLTAEPGLDYENLVVRWYVESWGVEGAVELAKSKRGKAALYFSLSEAVPKRQIKADLEKKLGVKLKTVL